MRFLVAFAVFAHGFVAGGVLERRDTSPTDVCLRWAHQGAIVKDTLYIYGGRSRQSALQTSNTWNNDFIKLDLTNDFDIASAPLEGLPRPNGPPAVASGWLWNDFSSLYLYGGEYSDTPPALPDAFQLWKYEIDDGTWSVPDTNVQGGGQIQRSAEGAGVSLPNRGVGYYFGGHLDGYTTQGWGQSIPRLYLTSMVELDMGDGQWTNHTEQGADFPERADSVLTFIPWGEEGILLALGGGNNVTFSQLNVIDVFDIKNNRWTKQATSGPTPEIRVNACAVVFSAPDNSSHNVYMYGGQNLQPAGDQTQYDDMWILTIPSFTWVQVDTSAQSNPPGRSGHSCHAYRGQMLVVGGYNKELSCDSGIYVFDASTLEWKTEFKGGPNTGSDSTNMEPDGTDVFYGVPSLVVSQIGGGTTGGATVTTPERTPVPDSPLTGNNPDYTYNPSASTTAIGTPTPVTSQTVITSVYTDASGTHTTVFTATSTSLSTPSSTSSTSSPSNDKSSTPTGIIIGATVGGIVLLVLLLLGAMFLWYRRRVKALRNSLEEAQATQGLFSDGRPSSMSTYDGGATAMMGGGYRRSSSESKEDLMNGVEPSFWGMLLSPKRSLRVVNH